jgi:hypothetical protein
MSRLLARGATAVRMRQDPGQSMPGAGDSSRHLHL